jgi:hypothetical protein
MSTDEPSGSGKKVLIGGCLVLLLAGAGLLYVGQRVSKHEDAVKADQTAELAAAAAKTREAAIAAKQVLVGMTREEVTRAWGKPDRVDRSSSGAGVREQWAYENGSYVYFGSETVTSVEK